MAREFPSLELNVVANGMERGEIIEEYPDIEAEDMTPAMNPSHVSVENKSDGNKFWMMRLLTKQSQKSNEFSLTMREGEDKILPVEH